eukprot:1502839-Rhodomonas_salina.1
MYTGGTGTSGTTGILKHDHGHCHCHWSKTSSCVRVVLYDELHFPNQEICAAQVHNFGFDQSK